MRSWRAANPSTIVLARGELASLRLKGGRCRVSCVVGRLWLTVTGRHEDFVLVAGEKLTIEDRGRIVVEALHTATVRIERGPIEVPPPAVARRSFSPAREPTWAGISG